MWLTLATISSKLSFGQILAVAVLLAELRSPKWKSFNAPFDTNRAEILRHFGKRTTGLFSELERVKEVTTGGKEKYLFQPQPIGNKKR